MLKLKSFAAAILAAGALSACSVESLVDDINQAGIDIAFDAIKQTVEAQGGAAARVTPGAEVILEVTNTSSPIAGATVKVPAGAVPSDVEIAAISIYHLPLADGANEDVVVHGNGAIVALTKLPGGEAIVPAVALTISLPVTSESTKPIEQIVLGTVDLSAAAVVAVEGSKGDAAKKQAVGDTTELKNAFAASWAVDYTGGAADEDTLIYKITKADDSVCVGARALNDTNVQASIAYDTTPLYTFALNLGVTTLVTHTATQATAFGTPAAAASGTVSIPVDTNFTVTCGGTPYAVAGAPSVATLTLSEYAEASSTAVVAGFTRTGSVKLKGEFNYLTAGGDQVQAAFDATKSDFSWMTEN